MSDRKTKIENNFKKLFQSISDAQSSAYHKADKSVKRITKQDK